MPEDLNKYGFITAAWKRGIVIGIIIILCTAIVWLATTTVPESVYTDSKDRERELVEQLRVCNDETKDYLMYGGRKLDQVQRKQDTLESAVITNAETFSNTKNELQNEARKH